MTDSKLLMNTECQRKHIEQDYKIMLRNKCLYPYAVKMYLMQN